MLLRTRQSVIAVEKTLKYQLDESYAEGYNDAREEIVSKLHLNCNCSPTHLCSCCRARLVIEGNEI